MIGELLGICLEAYISLMISGYMAAKANLWGEAAEVLGTIFAYFFLTIGIFVLPILTFIFPFMNKK